MGIFQADMRKSDFVYTVPVDVNKGDVQQINNVLVFAENDVDAGYDVTCVFKCVQCRANKKIGTAEDILKGQRVYIDMTDLRVSATKGAGYLFVGWAKEDADGSDDDVLIEYDGTLFTIF
jgi:predicted RecA/RadA family phage recombinase